MRSERKTVTAICLSVLFFAILPGRAQEKAVCEVSIAALSLAPGSNGLIHWRDGDKETTPLQLSTRYFSPRLKLRSQVIQFFKDPFLAMDEDTPPPEPLLTLRIPEGQKLVYIVLVSDLDENKKPRWRATLLSAAEWKAGSLKVFNAGPEAIGIVAGKKQLRTDAGKSTDFHVRDWKNPFPVKIFQLQPEMRLVFSSTWRVAAGRRELCFIGNVNGALSLRSLMELDANPDQNQP